MAADIEVSLLGPLEVRTGTRTLAVVGVKQQVLLLLLALAVPHGVSDDRLIDELWGDDRPANPANALQALVSHVRRLLARDTLVRHGNGYVLRVDPQAVDAVRLEQFVHDGLAQSAAGDHRAAATSLRAAVDLVRGPPFAELADQWFAREAVGRLDELILTAHERLIDSELALGRHLDVLPSLTDLVARHPARERFRAQLMIALYRCGRQTDALHAYREARRHLLEELGLDPGPELRQLERSVLAHDPTLAAPITLPSAVATQSEIPVPLTSFVGRQAELAAVERDLAACRLASLVGPGGVGKTRLALEVARRVAECEEVWFIELAQLVPRSDSVEDAVATGVGAPDRDGISIPPLQRARERLGPRRALVVLDNCEHVLDNVAAVIVGLLTGCPGLRVLTTTREPVGVDGERLVPVRPLPPDDAVELFITRARDAQPMFDADDGEVAKLVDHLDRLPLAIELAAARMTTLPVTEIVERLDDRFGLLRRPKRGGLARHGGLEATIDWSYDLLFAGEQEAFQRLAVFPAGATIDAVERMCGADGLELASRLVDRSLLVADTSGPAVRFSMLESVRAYGCRRLESAGRLDEVRDELVAWCIELAELAAAGSLGREQLVWLDRLDVEHDNIRSALDHAVEHRPEAALRLLGALIRPWWFRGRRQEIRQWAATVLDASGDENALLRARVMSEAGLMAEPRRFGDGSATTELKDELLLAERDQREAIAIHRRHGDGLIDLAYAQLCLLATLARRASMGESLPQGEAAVLVADATAMFDASHADFGSGVIRTTDAILAIAEGDLERAAAQADAAAPIVRRLGERFSSGRLKYVRGMLDDLAGNPRAAYRHLEQSVRLMSELGLHPAVTSQVRLLAPLAEQCGEPMLAAQWRAFLEDRDAGWTHYDGTVIAAARNHTGVDVRHAGNPEEAARAHRSALEWYHQAQMHAGVAVSETCLAFVALAAGDTACAAKHSAAALDAAQLDDDANALACALVGVAAGAVADEPRRAARLLSAADTLRGTGAFSPAGIADDVATITDALRTGLGDEALAAEIDPGRRLDRRAAIVLASA